MEPGDPEQPGGARHDERKVRRNLDRLAAMKMEIEELVERNGEEVGSSVYRAYVAAIVNDVCTVGMLDSGNTFHTVISDKFAKELGIDIDNLKIVSGKEMVGTAKDGAQLKVLGQVRSRLTMRLSHGTPPIVIKPFVVKGLAMPLNISGPLMERCGMSIKVGRYVKYRRYKVPLATQPKAETRASVCTVCPLYLAKDVEIGPKQMVHLPVAIPSRMADQYVNSKIVVMADEGLTKGKKSVSAFNRTMVKTQLSEGKLYAKVGIWNNSDRVVRFRRGTFYGRGYPTAEQEETNPEPWKIQIIGNIAYLRGQSHKEEVNSTDKDSGRVKSAIKARHSQFKREGQTRVLDEWMEGPTTKMNYEKRCKHVIETFKIDENENLKVGERKRHMVDLLVYFWEVFSWDGRIGNTDLIYHNLTSKAGTRPVRQKVRSIHPALEPSLQQQLLKWLDNEIIEPSDSNWNTNLLAVYKPGGDVRWVLDFTALNRVTEIDTFPVGDVQSNLSRLGKSEYFSVLDSQGAYHVVPIHPDDRYKTAFITPWNSFQFRFMPFGMASAGSTFCRLNQLIMGKAAITTEEALSYIDDLLILGASFDGHLRNLYKTMRAYAGAGLLLNPKKCEFVQSQVKYLGHIISKEGAKMIPDYVKAVEEWPLPKTRKNLRIVLGKMNYYKKFIKGFAQIARPLTDALGTKGEFGHLGDEEEFSPGTKYEEAFNELKCALAKAPQLAHPRFDNMDEEVFVMDTDWSEETQCISAALHQRQWQEAGSDGKRKMIERPIAFMSKKLPEASKSYTPMKGELAAVIYYLDYFEFYARTGNIVLRTDHQALLALRNSTEKRGQWARWRQRLSLYNYTIEHRKGVSNANADALSRAPHIQRDESTDIDIFNEEEDGLQIHALEAQAILRIGSPALRKIRRNAYGRIVAVGYDDTEYVMTAEDLKEKQESDESLREIRRMLESNEVPSRLTMSSASPELRNWLHRYDQLSVDRNGLVRFHTILANTHGKGYDEENGGKEVSLVALPEEGVYDVAKMIHVKYAHLAFQNTFDKVRQLVYGERLRATVEDMCKQCIQCQLKGGKKPDQRHTYRPNLVKAPWEVVNLDFCGPYIPSTKGNCYILTIEDLFTRWIEAIPVRKANAQSVFNALTQRIFPIFGLPDALKTDNAPHFVNQIVEDLARMLKIEVRNSIPYNPQSNPVERAHLNIKRALTALCGNRSKNWESYLPEILFALRTAKNRITGYSPYELVFGDEPRSRLEHVFGEPPGQDFYETYHQYVKALKNRIMTAHKWARKNIGGAIDRKRQMYNKKFHSFEIGDKVWLFNPRVARVGQRSKLKSVWSGPWTVKTRLSDINYILKPHPLWARKGEVMVSCNRIKPYLCAPGDEHKRGYPPAIDQDVSMAGDNEAERIHDAGTESDDGSEEGFNREQLNEDNLAVNFEDDVIHQNNGDQFEMDEPSDEEGPQFWWDDDLNAHVHREDFEHDFNNTADEYGANEYPVYGDRDDQHHDPYEDSDTEDDEVFDQGLPEQEGHRRQLRNRDKVDYYQLHHGRPRRGGRGGHLNELRGRKVRFDAQGHWQYDQRHQPLPPSDDGLRRLTDQSAVLHRRNAASEQSAQRFIHKRPS